MRSLLLVMLSMRVPSLRFAAEIDGHAVVDANGVSHGLVPVGLRRQNGILVAVTPAQLRGTNGEVVLPPG